MAKAEWIEIAKKYSHFNEQDRAAYWNQLDATQRQQLEEALKTPLSGWTDRAGRPSQKGGCSSPLAYGCMGIVLGVVLTIGAQIAAISMGIQAIGNAISGVPSSDALPSEADVESYEYHELLRYCDTDLEKRYRQIESACVNERIHQNILRRRQEEQRY